MDRAMPSRGAAAALAVLAALAASCAEASSMYIGKMCRGHTCTNTHYPILDYVAEDGKCICRQHPCWNAEGMLHSCPTFDFPYLTFSYDLAGVLSCGCSSTPFYASMYLAKEICPERYCETPGHPILDWDEDNQTCVCRAHPCHDLDGMRHGCGNPKAPILRYREDLVDGVVKPVCECVPKLEMPKARDVEL